MKYHFIIILIFLNLRGFNQVVPNVSIDSLMFKLAPIYSQALNSGIYNLPRDTAWLILKKYEAPGIAIEVPDKWINLGGLSTVVETAFDASGLYFPDTFNMRPVLAGLFLLNQPGNSLNEAMDMALKDYRLNTDRVFDPGYRDSAVIYKLKNGNKGYVLHTRFLRTSSQLNQSRYDLILFSEKYKKSYSVMVSVQYADPTYHFENDNALGLFALRLFSRVTLE